DERRPRQMWIRARCGCAEKSDQKFLSAVIRQAVIAGYLERDIENYGLLKLTPKAKKFLDKPVSFKIVEDREFNDEEEAEVLKSGAGCAADPELYSILKDLRKKIARQNSLPPYVIFQDPSLEAMATTYPINIEELAGIAGVGAGKARRYGKEFVEVIRKHVEENDIDRPEDLVVRSLANKSKVKISIIHSIDRKIDLNEIADSKGMEFDELLDEIESIVNSGTKININYYIDEMLDEDQQDEVFDWFKQSESGMLEDAYQEFGSDYSEEEIRLMRIKFISDMGY
ncbi:MAG: HRDC domain-containing protein, partial [Paramuribaculum sp.]|nr:HRDC domain-containing protein [Paramuribaculum sp.]